LKSNRLLRIWLWPLALVAVTIAGLICALLGDGVWDALSWVLLSIPLIVLGVFYARG
jgi:hydrogenase/urease accessory protein HupE